MSTNALIGQKYEDGSVRFIYTHWDGYPDHHFPILSEYWNSPKRIDRLLTLGSLSILGTRIGRKVKFDTFRCEKNNQCLAYKRDRGETEGVDAFCFQKFSPAKTAKLAADCGGEWLYLFDNGLWNVFRVSLKKTQKGNSVYRLLKYGVKNR